MILPLDMREWVRDDDLANFLLVVIEGMDLSRARVNQRGTGSAQYPPGMMLAVLVYCYATGIFSSRQIERLTHQHVSVRFLAGNEHPDHDTLCTFRRENKALLQAAFAEVLRLAGELKLGQVGTICIDGTKIVADAAKRHTMTEEELRAQQTQLDLEIARLLEQAEQADAQASPDGASLPEELRGRQRLREQVAQAREKLAAQVQERAAERERDRAAWRAAPLGDCPRALPAEPQAKDRLNLTDPESKLMPQAGKSYVQGYNAQLAVSAELQSIILAAEVCVQINDRQQLLPMAQALPPAVRAQVQRAVVDTGYDHPRQIVAVEERFGWEVICAPQRPPKKPVPAAGQEPDPEPETAPPGKRQATYRTASQEVRARLREQVENPEGKAWLKLRRMTVEPVFGLIKAVLGFRRFRLRGLAKADLEWKLVALAFNCRRLCHLHAQAQRTS